MKKFAKLLAMVLAVSMVLTMFVGAVDYKDAASIDEDKAAAVQTVYEAGIMMGNDKGEFNPTSTLTRDEMAKILFALESADQQAGKIYGILADEFADSAKIPAWSKNFVGYASVNSLIVGNDKNEVNALGTLSYVEAAIVLLRSLDLEVYYDYSVGEDDYDGFTGPKWFTNAVIAADNAGLLSGLDIVDFNDAITREDVAVMITNAIASQKAVDDNETEDEEDDVIYDAIYSLAESATGTVLAKDTIEVDDEDVDVLVLSNDSLIPMGNLDIAEVAGKEISVVYEGEALLDVVVGDSEPITTTLDTIAIEEDEDDASKLVLTVDDEVVLKNIFDYELYIFEDSAVAGVAYDEGSMGTVLEMIAAEFEQQKVTLLVNENSVSVFYAPISFVTIDPEKITEDYNEEDDCWTDVWFIDENDNANLDAGELKIDADYVELEDAIVAAAKVIDGELIVVGVPEEVDGSKLTITKSSKGYTAKLNGEAIELININATVDGQLDADNNFAWHSENWYYANQGTDAVGTLLVYNGWVLSVAAAEDEEDEDDSFYAVIVEWVESKMTETDDVNNGNDDDDEVIDVTTVTLQTASGKFDAIVVGKDLGLVTGALYQIDETPAEGEDAYVKVKLNSGLVTATATDDANMIVETLGEISDEAEVVYVNMVDDANLATELEISGGIIKVAGEKVKYNTVKAFWVDGDTVVVVYDLEKKFGVYGDIAAK